MKQKYKALYPLKEDYKDGDVWDLTTPGKPARIGAKHKGTIKYFSNEEQAKNYASSGKPGEAPKKAKEHDVKKELSKSIEGAPDLNKKQIDKVTKDYLSKNNSEHDLNEFMATYDWDSIEDLKDQNIDKKTQEKLDKKYGTLEKISFDKIGMLKTLNKHKKYPKELWDDYEEMGGSDYIPYDENDTPETYRQKLQDDFQLYLDENLGEEKPYED